MVSRKVLENRGVFTGDMDDIQEQFMEIHETVLLLCKTEEAKGEVPAVLQSVARAVLRLSSDVGEIDEVLRERGAITTAEETIERKRVAVVCP